MPNNTEDWSKYEVKTAAEPQAEDWSQYEVKKKEEPFSFGTSTSLEFPSVSTQKEEVASQEPLTYMQKQLREKGLITEDTTDPNKINDVLRKVPLSFIFPHADEKFLEKSRNPLDVTGKEEDKQVVRQPLSEEDNMAVGANIDTKQESSYFWGTVKAINQGTSSFFRTLDNATKTLEDLTGIPSGGGFGKIADSVDDVANKMPDVPDTRGGRLLRNVGNLEGMFLELAITPELKVAKIGAVPKLITQMTGAGFVNSYGDAIAKEPEKINRVIEGVKGAGGGLKDAAILTALGYGSAIAGSAVGKAVGSEVAGSVASTLTNAVGFAGSDAIAQLITTGNIDKNQLEQSFDVGLALGIPEIAKTIGTRAMVNYFTASPKVEKEAAATTKDVETLREEAINTRKDAQLLDADTRAAEEAKANVLDGIADVKVMSSEVSKDPEKFKQSIAEDETLSPEQKDAFTKKIDETVKLQEEKQKEPSVVEDLSKISNKDLANEILGIEYSEIPMEHEKQRLVSLKEEAKRRGIFGNLQKISTSETTQEIKPIDAIPEPVVALKPEEALIVSPEQKEGLKQTKQESVVGVKPFKIGRGGTKGTFIDSEGTIYKSIIPTELRIEDGVAKRVDVKDKTTEEHSILSELQDRPYVPKIGNIVETNEGKAFSIEKLDEVESITREEYLKLRTQLNELNDGGYHIGDNVTVMRRPKTKELVIVDFSNGYKGDRGSRDIEYLNDVESMLSPRDKTWVRVQKNATDKRLMADLLAEKKEGEYEYWLTQRPPSIGTHPIDNLIGEPKEGTMDGREVWKLTYSKELPISEVKRFELSPILSMKDYAGKIVNGVMGDVPFYVSNIVGRTVTIKTFNPSGKVVENKIRTSDFIKKIEDGEYEISEPSLEQQNIPLQEQITEVKQVKQQENGKEIRGNEAQRQRRQERLLRVQEIDAELGNVWSDLADIVGAKISLTGEQRAKIMPVVSQLAKLYTEKYALKGMDLVDQIIEHFSSKGIKLDEETTNQISQQYARESRKVADEVSQQTQGVVEGEERPIRVRDNEQARANEGQQKGGEVVSEGEKPRKQGIKIIESTSLPEDIKSDFKKEGIGYVPRGRKVTKAEASQIVKAKMEMEGGREQVKSDILNLGNGISGDTRIQMAVDFINDAKIKLSQAKTPEETTRFRNDISEILASTMKRSTDVATELEANKMITQLLNSDPEFVEDIYRNEVNKKNESFYQAERENIKSAQDVITEYLNSEEFKSKYKVRTEQTEGKLTSKQLRERGINKVANATSKLADIIGAKKNFTQEEMGKGTDVFNALKELGDGLLDIGVASTKELLDKIKLQTRKYFKPSEIDAVSKELLTELDAENRLKQKTQKTIALDSKDEKAIVDRLYSKGIKATDKQLRQLLADNIDLLIREGSINDESFRELFAKAMGKEFVDQKQIDLLKINAKLVTDVKRVESELEKLYNELIDAELKGLPKEELNKLRKQVSDKIKEYSSSRHEAEKAVKSTGEVLSGKTSISEKVTAVVKGNLITPASQVVNIIANYSMLPIRAAKDAIASWMDTITSGIGFGIDKLRESQKQKIIDYVNSESTRLGIPKEKVVIPRSLIKTQRLLDKLPSSERKKIGSGFNLEMLKGELYGYKQGIRQLWTGALPTDLQRVELRGGLHPLDALVKNYNMLSGKEKLEFKEFVKNAYEGTIGVAPEVTFRFLNLFDKPVRTGAERSKLDELAKIKGLKGAEREKFMELPDEESAEIARKAGDEATFQQDTYLSNAFSKLDKWSLKKAQEATNVMSKVGYYTLYYAKNMVVPFVKTPINVEMEMLGYAVPEYSIARALNSLYKGDRVGFENHMATAAVGSFMLRGIGYLFGAGILTLAPGGQEDDTDEKDVPQKIKTAEYRDKPAYYINIDAWQRDIHNKIYGTNLSLEWQDGDQISSYRRFGIVSAMTMAQAEAFRGKSKEEIQQMTFWQTSHTSLMPLVKSGAEQTFVAGTSSLINVFIGSEQERDNFFLGLSKAAGATVLPNAMKTYVQANDNYIRDTRDATLKEIDALKYRVVTDFKASLPLVTKTDIPTKITIWGERVNRYEDGSSPAFQLFDITKTKTYKRDFGTKIFELYERVSQDDELKKEIPPKSILPPVLMNKVRYKEEDVTLDPKTYEDMQLFVGSRLKEKTWAALSSMDWDNASDKHKFQKLKQLYGSQNSFRSKLIDRYVRSNKQKLDSLWLTQYGAK